MNVVSIRYRQWNLQLSVHRFQKIWIFIANARIVCVVWLINVMYGGTSAFDALAAATSPYWCRSFELPTESDKCHELFRLDNHTHYGMAFPMTKISEPNRCCVGARPHTAASIYHTNWIHRMWLHAKLSRMFRDRLNMLPMTRHFDLKVFDGNCCTFKLRFLRIYLMSLFVSQIVIEMW